MASEVREAFGSKGLYEILGVQPTATASQLKKAYFKLALKWHPDKNGGSKEATKRFQALTIVHQVLSDPDRRSVYDDCGEFDDSDGTTSDTAVWESYWRTLYPKVTADSIAKFSADYRESKQELSDVLDSYNKSKGDMAVVVSEIMCCDSDDDERFCNMVTSAIDSSEVKRFAAFTKHMKRYTKARTRKPQRGRKRKQREAAEAKQHAEDLGLALGPGQDSLVAMIQARRGSGNGGLLAQLEAKYARPKKKQAVGKSRRGKAEPSEEEFQRLRQQMEQNRKRR